MKRPMSCIQEQPTEGVRPNARENGQISPIDQVFGLREVLVAVSTSRLSCKRAGKTRTLMPVWDSSGESRFYAAWETGKGLRALAREFAVSVTQVEQALDRCLPIFDAQNQLRAFKFILPASNWDLALEDRARG
jgi:hypothetical protein